MKSIVLVFDQTLNAKATEVQWKQSERFKDIVLRMRVFHTACTLLSIIGKRFQDAVLRGLCVESGVIAEGSVAGVLDGRRYNRGVILHKIMYEALMRLARQRFVVCMQENQKESKTTVDSFFSEIGECYDDFCETQFKKHMTSTSSVDFVKLFDKYLEFLRLFDKYLEFLRHAFQVLVVLPRYARDSPQTESLEGRQKRFLMTNALMVLRMMKMMMRRKNINVFEMSTLRLR